MNLKNIAKILKGLHNITCMVYKRVNGLGTIYYELNINKVNHIKKLIGLKVIPNILR